MPKKLTQTEIVSQLDEMAATAVGYSYRDVEKEQDDALKIYRGEPYGDEEEGMSQVVMRDAAECVDWVMPDVMRVFAASESGISLAPSSPDDIDAAKQITDYLKYTFWRDNNGFRLTHDFAFTGMVQKNGFMKVYWDEQPIVNEQVYEDLSRLQVALFERDDEVEIIDVTGEPLSPDVAETEAAQAYPDGFKYRAVIRREGVKKGLKYEALPVSEVLYSPRAKSLQEAEYVAHRVPKTKTQLLAEGLVTEKELEGIKADDRGSGSERRDARFEDKELEEKKDSDLYWLYEEFVLLDVDGDGKPERRRIVRLGNKILDNDYWDGVDIATWSPKPQPHQVTGQSSVDDVKDIQRINTVIVRQLLDNLYLTNNPRKVVNISAMTEDTMNDLLNHVVGGVVRVNGDPAASMRTDTVDFFGAAGFNMLEFMEERKQQRTGVTRLSQGIPENALNETAAVPLKMMAKAEMRKEFVLRNLAEGMTEVFRIALRIIKKHQDFERTVRLTEQWVAVDPRTWTAEFDFEINVGLGTGDKDNKVNTLNVILERQIAALQGGTGLADTSKIYNTLTEMVDAMGLTHVSEYFVDPGTEAFQPPEPEKSDAEIKAETQIQIEQMRIAADEQKHLRDLEAKRKIKAEELAQEFKLREMEMEAEAKLTGFKTVVDAKRSADKHSNTNIARD